MARDVNYSVVGRRNPQDKNLPLRYYAKAQSRGDVTVQEMAMRIEKSCTVTKADTMAVLTALEDVIIEALSAGEIVRLADLGCFQIGLSGEGSSTSETYSVSLIKKAHINFRPSRLLRDSLTKLNYARVPQKSARQKTDEEQMG
ncbi:MAG: HU family DNA-binding protein [Phocaeicola sp.]